jgi:hypothetical protein
MDTCTVLKVHKHDFFLQKPKPYGPKGLYNEIFENRILFGRDIRLLNISAYAQPAMKSIPHAQPAIKFVPRMLSVR